MRVIRFGFLMVALFAAGCTSGTQGTPGKVAVTSTADLGKVAGGQGPAGK